MSYEIIGSTRAELETMMEEMGEEAFRGRQLYNWVYKNLVFEVEEMTNLPCELRNRIRREASFTLPVLEKESLSKDGTIKMLLGLADGQRIETVIIPQTGGKRPRYTLCLSSQVGCPVGCPFCATGQSGFVRNLTVGEIVGQVLVGSLRLREGQNLAETHAPSRLTNVVFMGMGEPFLNYDAVMKAIYLLNDPEGLNIGQRHITVSTAGEATGIRRFAQEGLQVTLAVSLHSARDEVRERLVPLSRKYPLPILREALRYYCAVTSRRVTLEYTLLDGINTSKKDALSLIGFVQGIHCNINLIPYNRVENTGFRRPSPTVVARFQQWLREAGVNSVVREEKGSDIEGACGQLRAHHRVSSRAGRRNDSNDRMD